MNSHLKKTFLLFCLLLLCSTNLQAADYVGREKCKSCHQEQDILWQGSHHDLAMQHVNEKSVLGDFSNITFNYAGISSEFYKKDKRFMVRTDGADGKLHDYEIKYTFGVTPLQQYLIELEGGRLQALSIAWDSRKKSDGGQRWFHLYPGEEITHKDELHWTRPSFNWNGMCAECHSTNLQKNYDSQADTFTTRWSEINVSCEACHGPASNHLSWASRNSGWEKFKDNKGLAVLLDERNDVHWVFNEKTGSALRSQERQTEKEIEVCAQCHSRRSSITDNYQPGKPFSDHYMPRLLDEHMYFSDGQIQDEVYVYGSFLQSKMYHKGVTCSDCHDPHSLQLRQEGNAVCLQCHAAEKFASKKHHFHKVDSTAALCAECHMPTRDYMVVDPRHDHSIRVPRPDLSVSLGTPNACNQCHQNKPVTWAAARVKEWYGKPFKGYQQYAHALDAGRKGSSKAGEMLAGEIRKIETPDIARASAITALSPYLDQSNIDVLQDGLKNDDAMVRLASVSALEGLPQAMLVQLAFPLIDDPVRSVRIEAARVMAAVPVGQLQGEQLKIYKHAMNEYINSQMVNAERPEAQLNLGNFYTAKGDIDKAIMAYKKSIMLEDVFVPAYINLADLYRAQENDTEAEKVLRKAIKIAPENVDAYYALGLSLVRQKKNDEALKMLQRAAGFETTNAHYVYVYAVALNSTGKKDIALDVLRDANARFPQDTEILNALVAFNRDAGNEFAMQAYMKKLKKLNQK
jgi:predicted CXXCH cytochrome family protein